MKNKPTSNTNVIPEYLQKDICDSETQVMTTKTFQFCCKEDKAVGIA